MPDEQAPPPPPRQLPPAGWYPDPDNPETTQRYWDGQAWTESHAPLGAELVSPTDPPQNLGVVEGLAVAGLTLAAVLAVFSIVTDFLYVNVLTDLIDGRAVDPGEVDEAHDLVDAATVAFSLA